MRKMTGSVQPLQRAQVNLLVVFLLVEPYKLARGKSREILPRTGAENQGAASKARLQPRGYDFLRFLSEALAANRVWPPDHRSDTATNSSNFQGPCRPAGSGVGRVI